jgi:hypothetical protein
MTAAARDIAMALGKACREGRGWRCLCPLHGGCSLVLRDGRDALLVRCWGGCATGDVLAELRSLGLIETRPSRPASPPHSPRLNVDDDAEAAQLKLVRYLFDRGQPVERSPPALRYLREARAYAGPIPPTIRYLPAANGHKHALVCAYGEPDEIEVGVLHVSEDTVRGVHLIKLNADGSDRHRPSDDDPDPAAKITIGRCVGSPIVCGPFSDSNNGLVIAEGVEDTLVAFEVMKVAAWAAGGASRMPALADAVPDWVDSVSILVDDDPAGRLGARRLAERLHNRFPELEVRPIHIGAAT